MHSAIYGGVPVANHAFAMAKKLGWGELLYQSLASIRWGKTAHRAAFRC